MTLVKMESYELEYEYQMALVSSREHYVRMNPMILIATPFKGSIDNFRYRDFAMSFSRLLTKANENDILTLARQGLYKDDDGGWHVFVDVQPEGDLTDKVDALDDMQIIRIPNSKLHVHSFCGSNAEKCFKDALTYPSPTPPRWIIEGWAVYITTKSYATLMFY